MDDDFMVTAFVVLDEASIADEAGVRLVPPRKANMRPNIWADKLALRANPGLQLRLHARLAVIITNAD